MIMAEEHSTAIATAIRTSTSTVTDPRLLSLLRAQPRGHGRSALDGHSHGHPHIHDD